MPRPPEDDREDRQLTPDECARVSDQTQDLAFSLSVTDVEQLQEEVFGKALVYGTPAEAIAAMERRIAEMRKQKAEALNTLDDCSDSLREPLLKQIDELNQQIAATQARLDAYRFQQDREN